MSIISIQYSLTEEPTRLHVDQYKLSVMSLMFS